MTTHEYDPPDSYAGTWRYWVHTAALNGRPAADVTQTVSPFRTRTVRTPTADDPVFVVRGDQLRDDGTPAVWESRENATLTAHVTDTGLVRFYRTEYTTTTDSGEPVRVRRTVRFHAVGNTSVGPPTWADHARSTAD